MVYIHWWSEGAPSKRRGLIPVFALPEYLGAAAFRARLPLEPIEESRVVERLVSEQVHAPVTRRSEQQYPERKSIDEMFELRY